MKRQLPKYVPVMKGNPGAFTCLGNWYDLDSQESMASLDGMIKWVRSKTDLKTAKQEIAEAKDLLKNTGYAYPGNM